MERFTGLLIEHFADKFPTWLAPEQVRVLPISDKVADFAEQVRKELAAKGVRVKLDDAPDKIGAKIRNARLDRVPYMLVVGQREAEEGMVSVRHRELDVVGTMKLADFVTSLSAEIEQRLIAPAFTPQQKETPQP